MSPLKQIKDKDLVYYTVPLFERADGALALFTTRLGGVSGGPYRSLNLGLSTGDSREAVLMNRRIVLSALGREPGQLVLGHQVHGTAVRVIDRVPVEGSCPDTDGLLTSLPGVTLMTLHADCVPILLYDPVRRVVGAVHSGWRGTAAGILRQALARMTAAFGSRPADILAAIGPSIGPCCYEIDSAVAGNFRDRVLRPSRPGHYYLDLWQANRMILLDSGVPGENVESSGLCTACRTDLFYSHRAEGRITGRIGAFITLEG